MADPRENARTTPDAVRDIFETGMDDGELAAFINVASYRVDDIESAGDVADDRLAEIEKWLAAHAATTRPELPSSEQQDSYRVSYLRETTYGQEALKLDPTGTLAGANDHITFGTVDAKGIRDT